MLAFMLCACGQSEKNKDEEISIDTSISENIISNDMVDETEDEDVSDALKDKLLSCGIASDSYIYDFLNNEYAIEFDPVAYEEKIHEQLPQDCASLYDSDIYVEGTLDEMMYQYRNYFDHPVQVRLEAEFITNSHGEAGMMVYISKFDSHGSYFPIQMYLLESSDGIEVVYMRDDFEEEGRIYNDGYLYTVLKQEGIADLYFTRVDENGDFILVAHKHYESENEIDRNCYAFYDSTDFKEVCRNFVEQQGQDYDELISNEVDGIGYGKQLEFILLK